MGVCIYIYTHTHARARLCSSETVQAVHGVDLDQSTNYTITTFLKTSNLVRVHSFSRFHNADRDPGIVVKAINYHFVSTAYFQSTEFGITKLALVSDFGAELSVHL